MPRDLKQRVSAKLAAELAAVPSSPKPRRVTLRQLALIYQIAPSSLHSLKTRHGLSREDIAEPHFISGLFFNAGLNRSKLIKKLECPIFRHGANLQIAKIKFPNNPGKWPPIP
jgi:hypothetical protein